MRESEDIGLCQKIGGKEREDDECVFNCFERERNFASSACVDDVKAK